MTHETISETADEPVVHEMSHHARNLGVEKVEVDYMLQA